MERLTAGVGSADESGKAQVTHNPCNYMTESDWAYIRDNTRSLQQVCVRVRERLRIAGLIKPSEKCFGSIASMVACAREPDMTSLQLKALVDDLKRSIVPSGVPVYLQVFPMSPVDLPRSLYQQAYTDEEPCPREFMGFDSMVKRCPVRGSHKSLRAASPARGSASSGSASSGSASTAMQPFMEMMNVFAQQMCGRNIVFGRGGDGGGDAEARPDGIPLRILAPGVAPAPASMVAAPAPASMVAAPSIFGGMVAAPPPPSMGDAFAGSVAPACGGMVDGRPVVDGAGGLATDGTVPALTGAETMGKVDVFSGSPTDVVDEMERMARGVAPCPAAASAGPLKRPATCSPTPSTTLKLKTKFKLGCGRCRGSPVGCLTCRSPGFKGTRWQRGK